MKGIKTCTMKKERITFQRREASSSEHCCVPLCNFSARFSSRSFHSFPADDELRKKWVISIRRDNFTFGKSSVCGRYSFLGVQLSQYREGCIWRGGSATSLKAECLARCARDRALNMQRIVEMKLMMMILIAQDHDYCAVPASAAVDLARSERRRYRVR